MQQKVIKVFALPDTLKCSQDRHKIGLKSTQKPLKSQT